MNKIYIFALLGLFSIAAFSAVEDEGDLIVEEDVVTSYQTPLNAGLDIQYAPTHFPAYRWSDQDRSTETGKGVHLALEWLPLGRVDGRYGKPGIGIGSGFHWVKNIPLKAYGNANSQLYTVPVESFLSYRADFFDNQVLVPFAKVGLSMTLASQDIELPGGLNSSHYTYYGFDYSVGLEFCLNVLDRKSARSLDASMGINATYFIFEYLNSSSLTQNNTQDLSHSEYRLGLRFEI